MVLCPDNRLSEPARTVEDNLRTVRQAGHTRYPLCEDDLTTVIGIVHVKDLLRAQSASNGRPDLRKVARKVPFLPETLRLDQAHSWNSSAIARPPSPCSSTSSAASSAW